MTKSTIFHGYLVVAASFTSLFLTIGSFNTASLFLSPMSASFHNTSGAILALSCTLQIVAGLVSSLVGGIVQYYLEKKHIGLQWLFFWSGALLAVGSFWSSMAASSMGVLVGSFITGIGIGGGLMSSGICVLWFEESRGLMLGLANSGAGLGNIFFSWATPMLLEWYKDAQDPWRPTLRALGIFRFFLVSIASTAMRLPYSGEVEEHEAENAKGKGDEFEALRPNLFAEFGSVNSTESPMINSLRIRRRTSGTTFERILHDGVHTRHSALSRETVARRASKSTMLDTFQAVGYAPVFDMPEFEDNPDDDTPSLIGTLRQSLRVMKKTWNEVDIDSFSLKDIAFSKTCTWLNVFTFIVCFPYLNMQVLLPSYIASMGMSKNIAGSVLGMMGVGMVLSNLSLGSVADRIGAVRLLIIAFTTLSALFFYLPHCTTTTSLSLIGLLYGFFYCTIASMPLIILADAYGESSSEHILALNGIVNICKLPGYFLGPSIAGFLVDYTRGYSLAAYGSGLTMLMGTAMLLVLPTPDEQRIEMSHKKHEKSIQAVNAKVLVTNSFS